MFEVVAWTVTRWPVLNSATIFKIKFLMLIFRFVEMKIFSTWQNITKEAANSSVNRSSEPDLGLRKKMNELLLSLCPLSHNFPIRIR